MKMIDDVIIIGIDSGYGNIKTANCCFPASVSAYDKEPVFKENLLVYESKFYLIGEGHKEFLADKTRDLDYYVLALAAIARELNIRKMTCGKIRIAAGLPLTWVSGQRDEFRDYLMQNKAVDFSFRNVSYHVEIVGVDVFPQGFAAVADRLSDFRGVNMICDIGNGTMNIMFINDKKPVSGNMFTEKYGTHQCLLAVRENVMRAHTQLFQQLYYQADSVHGGRLPVHVHFVMDEFANVALPDEFDKLLSTMRSREISVSIIIQNLAQLKALFEKQWESIVGNCDEFLYLGGNEQSTHEYVSKLLGKETIDTNTYGRSRGRNGSYSTNYQLAGRELMTPDEVRMLDNQYALLFIRGERPIRDLKYDILHHPNVALTTDGSAPAYTHGEDTRSIASMAFSFDKKAVKNAATMEAEKHEFLLYSEEELEELLDEKEKKGNEET